MVQSALDSTFINKYDNIMELDKFGYHNSVIAMCCKRKIKTNKRSKWMYKAEHLMSTQGMNVV